MKLTGTMLLANGEALRVALLPVKRKRRAGSPDYVLVAAEEPRGLSDAEADRQAEALADYVARGGDAERWLRSKDLSETDRRAVLAKVGIGEE